MFQGGLAKAVAPLAVVMVEMALATAVDGKDLSCTDIYSVR